jgi:crossover junction endodeoxyribonuclease RuvC
MTVILGIDPGSRITGYGLIRAVGNQLTYIDSGCIRTTSKPTLSQRLLEIFNGVRHLMQAYTPGEVAIEQVFMHQNPSAALKLGHARGAAMVACASPESSVFEYAPRQIKQAVAGYGAAEKEQVKHMVMRLLALTSAPQSDASDALAVAICHSHARHQYLFRSKCT